MTHHPDGYQRSPWPWPPTPPPQTDQWLLWRLLERSEAMVGRLDRIDHRLEIGDDRMDQMSKDIADLKSTKREPMPGWERVIKSVAPYLIFLTALVGTGSVDAAIKILSALGTR